MERPTIDPGALEAPRPRTVVSRIGFVLGPVLAALAWFALPSSFVDASGAEVVVGVGMRATAALMAWMASWWLTEAVDVEATALLPLAAGPLLGAGSLAAMAAPYASPLIYLFLGGFLLAIALQRWSLDQRLALWVLARVGTGPRAVVGGFMLVTAGLSSCVSNMATTAAMLPLALSVCRRLGGANARGKGFETALMLGVAYAASIGGMASLIGTPPNGFLAQYAFERTGEPLRFVDWLGIGLPVVAVLLPATWLLLTRVLFRLPAAPLEGGAAHIAQERRGLGHMGRGAWTTAIVFAGTVVLWLCAPFLPLEGLSDAGIAIGAALLLFVVPVGGGRRALEWRHARELPWGVLVLFGGGLSLAAAIQSNGLDAFLGAQTRALADLPPVLLVLALTTGMVFLTEVTSNTASAAIGIPIVWSMADDFGLDPMALAVPLTLAASCAFMLPAATPPNAIVFGSGHVSLPRMARTGFLVNWLAIAVIASLGAWLAG
ncbi:Sodium-dependent dicarboxylate transporter SdcS [Planctomycetes bacterium Pla163]|uniref:Sodium-dependent dicarboxylate transporter SdcS n=1 Tax=Rohdeia mirabilis TaxID=2528008 RepID=A0A518D3B4_9BACT|nr:Sodium-dependent dicarboxylate transporter SdcS [Planctomycetes bacterium Pla163]